MNIVGTEENTYADRLCTECVSSVSTTKHTQPDWTYAGRQQGVCEALSS